MFGFDRFSLVTFLENNQLALKHFFLKDYQSDDKVVVYTKDQLFNYLHHAHEQVSPSQKNYAHVVHFHLSHILVTTSCLQLTKCFAFCQCFEKYANYMGINFLVKR